MNTDKRIKDERNRLEKLLDAAEVPTQQRAVLEAVMDNLAWQRIKLDEAREEMQNASIVCEYNNGGGQSGTRENPIFKAYINLWRAYMTGLEKYSSYLPKEAREEIVSSGMSVLDQVKQMQKARTN